MVFIISSLILGIAAFLVTMNIRTAIFTAIVGVIIQYFGMPVMDVRFAGLWFWALGSFICGYLLSEFFSGDGSALHPKMTAVTYGTFGVLLGVIFLGAFYSAGFFHASEYRDLLGEVKTAKFDVHVPESSSDLIITVDQDMARKYAEPQLGKYSDWGSRYRLGVMHIQNINNDLWWVGPMEFARFSKWASANKGSPAYVMVNARDSRKVKVVTDNVDIVYQTFGGWFGDNLKRHLYTHGFYNKGLTDFTLEVDDQGRPWWVATVYKNTIGFFGSDAIGVAIVDPHNGEINYVPVEEIDAKAPWVDRVQPEEFIREQVYDWGKYVKGWWNSFWVGDSIMTPTKGMKLVYNNGKSYWYTGIKLRGKNSSTGIMFIDTRNKEATWFAIEGTTEEHAKETAEGLVQEKAYEATWPILYNIGGVPTYVMALKSKAGITAMYAMINMQNREIGAVGKTIQDAYDKYRRALVKGSIGNAGISAHNSLEKVDGVIERIHIDNEKAIMLIKKGNGEKMTHAIEVLLNSNVEAALSENGDRVHVEFVDTDMSSVEALVFDNLDLDIKMHPKEAQGAEEANKMAEEQISGR